MDSRLIFEQNTSHDKDLATLIEVLAKCKFSRMIKQCSGTSCSSCRAYNKFMACYNQLATCDQLFVETKASELAVIRYKSFRKYNYLVHFCVGLIGCFLLFGFMCIVFGKIYG